MTIKKNITFILIISYKQDLIIICSLFQKCIKSNFSFAFPDDSKTQLWGAIEAVLKSWNCERAVKYRKIENISNDLGTAVNVQCMVFAIWATLLLLVLVLQEIHPQEKRNFLENGYKMLKGRMWWQVLEHLIQ